MSMRLLRCMLLILMSGASIVSANDLSCYAKSNALDASNSFIEKHMPDEFQPNYPKPILIDMGANWKVEYGLPESVTRGAPTVFIDKKTCKVVKAISGQ